MTETNPSLPLERVSDEVWEKLAGEWWATLTDEERENWLDRAQAIRGERSVEAAYLRMCSVSSICEIVSRLQGNGPEQA